MTVCYVFLWCFQDSFKKCLTLNIQFELTELIHPNALHTGKLMVKTEYFLDISNVVLTLVDFH